MTVRNFCALGVLAATLAGCGTSLAAGDKGSSCSGSSGAAMPMAGGQTIVGVAAADPRFSTLVAAVKAAGLADALSAEGPFTVFAPTNDAFAKLPEGTVQTLLKPENKAKLARILSYHVVPAKVMAAEAVTLSAAPTLTGQRLDLQVKEGGLTVDGAKVVQADVAASNGVIHAIDTVVMPSENDLAATAAAAGSFKTLLAAAKAAGLEDALRGEKALTVLAPTDEAFAKLPKETLATLLKPENKEALAGVLKLHIIAGRVFSDQALKAGTAATLGGETVKFAKDGSAVRVNGAAVVKADIDAANGVIHVIDTVLLPEKMPKLSRGTSRHDQELAMAEVATMAINRGAPLFNAGQPGACVAVYEVACRAISTNPATPSPVRARLERAMTDAAAETDDGSKAWALRHGLDSALAQMSLATR